MARRGEIFTKESIAALERNAPFIRLFKKDDWPAYLEITARIYDYLDESGSRADFGGVRDLVDDFFAERSDRSAKSAAYFRMAISDLGILKDLHDGLGNRFLEGTRAGKDLLKLCEEYIRNRLRFTGSGADDLLGAMNDLIQFHAYPTTEEAVQRHREKIREYEEDIKRIQDGGVRAGELVGGGYSIDELFARAESSAQHVLAAGEDIKLEIEEARRVLINLYRDKSASVGSAIRYAADFHEQLRSGPAYASFMRARDLLSYIPGLGGTHREKDVGRMYFRIREKNLVPDDLLRGSSLPEFMRRFRALIDGIEAKIQEQMNILRVQIHYVMSGDAKRVQEELHELTALCSANAGNAPGLFSEDELEIKAGLETRAGPLRLGTLEMDRDPEAMTIQANELTAEEFRALQQQLLKAEEASIARVLAAIREHVSRHGELTLSEYENRDGVTEYYVLANIEYFAEELSFEPAGRTDYLIRHDGGDFIIRDVENRRIFAARE